MLEKGRQGVLLGIAVTADIGSSTASPTAGRGTRDTSPSSEEREEDRDIHGQPGQVAAIGTSDHRGIGKTNRKDKVELGQLVI